MDSSYPKFELKLDIIDETIKLPEITVQKDLPQQLDDLVVVLTTADLDNLPPFLQFVKDNSYLEEDLRKKSSVFIYGRSGDIFKRCFVKVSTFSDYVTTLTDAGAFTRTLLESKLKNVSLHFSSAITREQISNFTKGVCLTNYKFERKGDRSAAFSKIASITIYHSESQINHDVVKFAKYPLFCREVLNTRALEANPTTMIELCKEIAAIDPKVQIETIVGKELVEKGLNLIYAVGRGGQNAPALAILKYEGNPENPQDIVGLIGKGVCFDAGGLNIKGTGNIETMYMDKGGACTVLAAFRGIVETKMPVNIVTAVAFVENLVGPDAVHPLDIIKSYKGLTVEIGNTDAEGRLILADAMTYTQLHYKPHTLIEFSTLTGAVGAAIGKNMGGLFTNSDKFAKELKRAGKEAGEPLWKLPLQNEHRQNMKATHGDLNNKSKNPAPGASNAAGFLEYFVEKGVTWAHIDFASAKSTDAEKYVYSIGATGFGVQLIINYLNNRQPYTPAVSETESTK